jgi:hypothetical protein
MIGSPKIEAQGTHQQSLANRAGYTGYTHMIPPFRDRIQFAANEPFVRHRNVVFPVEAGSVHMATLKEKWDFQNLAYRKDDA